jgi:5'-nucleotidase
LATILVINDDGINSMGLLILIKQLKKLGDVVVVTPGDEKSGIGKAISIGHVKVTEASFGDGIRAYETTGTPADSFLIAVNKILKREPDLVVSGINIGPNLGIDDLLTSGTVGATFEAAIHNVPAIAVSYCVSKMTAKLVDKQKVSINDLEVAATLARKSAKYVLENGMPPDVDIISINVPENADYEKITLTSLCYDGYNDIHTEVKDGYKIKSWALRHYPEGDPGTDLYTIKNGNHISITPIKLEFFHNTQAMGELMKYLST